MDWEENDEVCRSEQPTCTRTVWEPQPPLSNWIVYLQNLHLWLITTETQTFSLCISWCSFLLWSDSALSSIIGNANGLKCWTGKKNGFIGTIGDIGPIEWNGIIGPISGCKKNGLCAWNGLCIWGRGISVGRNEFNSKLFPALKIQENSCDEFRQVPNNNLRKRIETAEILVKIFRFISKVIQKQESESWYLEAWKLSCCCLHSRY